MTQSPETHKELLGLLGGTFDPIHCAHLQVALAVTEHLDLQALQFIPTGVPTHRPTPLASADHRAAMIELAIAPYPSFTLNPIELASEASPYTIDTLKSIAASYPNHRLCWILGSDSWATITSWHQWRDLCHYTHFIVIERPTHSDTGDIAIPYIEGVEGIHNPSALYTSIGKVYRPLINIDKSAVNATAIRLNGGDDTALPDAVYDYIQKHQLYRHSARS